MSKYRVELTPDDNGTVMVTFPDIPEAVTFGDDRDDALARAPDALETALAGYIQDRRAIPQPAAPYGDDFIELPLLAVMKIEAYNAMFERNWRKADLARELHLNPRQIDRLFDFRHATPVKSLEDAYNACGIHVDIAVVRAAA